MLYLFLMQRENKKLPRSGKVTCWFMITKMKLSLFFRYLSVSLLSMLVLKLLKNTRGLFFENTSINFFKRKRPNLWKLKDLRKVVKGAMQR